MAILLVTYDLSRPCGDRRELLRTIHGYAWAQLSESSYALKTEQTPQQVFDTLRPFLDKNDNLYVINLKRPYAGFGPSDVNTWLDEKLPF